MSNTRLTLLIATSAGLALPAMARPDFPESEPNETKATATLASGLVAGDTLSGNTTGSSTVAGAASLDTFLVKTAPAALGIYRWRLVLTTTGAAGHVGTIRGLGQTGAVQAPWLPGMVIGTPTATDTAIQTSSTATAPARFVQWYAFGKEEQIYYRVTGTATTTGNYTATLENLPVTPVAIPGTYLAGDITITTLGQGHTSDTEIHVYDGNLNPIRGYSCDDEAVTAVSGVPGATGTTLQSVLKRAYTPGTYFLAISTFNSCNELASPSDDDFRTGALMDFPGSFVNSSTTANVNTAFTISDGVTITPVPNTRAGAFDVNWFTFTVAGPSTGCYANCDGSTVVPFLNVNDFVCFNNLFAAGDTNANCDGSTAAPILNVNDFICFNNAFAAGCSAP